MLSQNIHFLTEVKGDILDKYLAAGWYRIYDLMFTTDSITLEERVIPVKWLRFDLRNFNYRPSAKKLLERNARLFEINILNAGYDDELESLYRRYRNHVKMDMAETIQQSLFSTTRNEIFETRLIELREGGRLIAAGYFDLGRNCAAGILNFYEPEYRKYSLGKYLMLEAIEHCRNLGMKYFYPGYIAEDYPKFDYKLEVCERSEVLVNGKWE